MTLQTRSDMELWDRPFQTLLLLVLLINVSAHVYDVPLWIFVASGTALFWKLGHLYFSWHLPNRATLYSAAALSAIPIALEYKTIFGSEVATPILVFLTSLKLLETNRDRDAMVVILASYFLLMTHLLHSQTLNSTLFMAFDVALITILMVQLHRGDRRITMLSIRPITRLLLFTVPVWLALFVLFPRFSVSIFKAKNNQQTTGFNEGLDPASVSSMAESNEIAFRVQFIEGKKRSPEALYWRGATLYDAIDLKWQPNQNSTPRERTPEKTEALTTLTYEVIAEPEQGRALFTLPRLIRLEPAPSLEKFRPVVTTDETVRLALPRSDRIIYRATSSLEGEGELETLSLEQRRRSLAVSVPNDERLRALAQELQTRVGEPSNVRRAIAKIGEWYDQNSFRYTLEAGADKAISIDDFLFRTRRGFCEHFAGASATLLRLMGYPTRVVVGFQGGKWNQFSNSLLIRSRDAHAWVEVWYPSHSINAGAINAGALNTGAHHNPNRGRWLTYDPTGAIAPLRISLGGDYLDLPQSHDSQQSTTEQILTQLSQSFINRIYDRATLLWDFAQSSWSTFLLNYDQAGQSRFLKLNPLTLVLILITLSILVLKLAYWLHSKSSQESYLKKEWLPLAAELTRAGVYKSPQDGPFTLADRVTLMSPVPPNLLEIHTGILSFAELYYGPDLTRDAQAIHVNHIRRAAKMARHLPSSEA